MVKKIAMSIGNLPQQRIYPIVTLPKRPEYFSSMLNPRHYDVQDDRYLTGFKKIELEGMPDSAKYMGTAEWAWSPIHNRIDAYHIAKDDVQKHWVLWSEWLDNNAIPICLKHYVYAMCPEKHVDLKAAAIYLLMDVWEFEHDNIELDKFHFLDNIGLLSVGEFNAIGRHIWRNS